MGRTIVATVLMTATGLPATAQPVLTAAGGIMPRYVINLVELDDPDVFCAQAGCTWNFTLNVGVSTAQVQLVAPGSAPGGGAFPMATVAAITAGSPNTPFMALDAGHLRTVGVFNAQADVYTDPLDVLVYPCTYGTTWTDSYTSPQTQETRTYTADGYGTLIGPAGTMENVLKVHSEYISLDTVAGGVHYTGHVFDDVFWHPDIHWPVATVTRQVVLADGVPVQEQSVGSIIAEIPIGLGPELSSVKGLEVWPNPAVDGRVQVTCPSPSMPMARLVATDVTGALVAEAGPWTGKNAELVLPVGGVYLVRAVDAAGRTLAVAKVVVP